eukprot:924125-Lingulodinium_polyedra.AAC.1
MCSYGCLYRKDTLLWTVRGDFLEPLRKLCRGRHTHVRLEGPRATAAAAYPPELCAQWAAV